MTTGSIHAQSQVDYFEVQYQDKNCVYREAISLGYKGGEDASIYDYVPVETYHVYGRYLSLRQAKLFAKKAAKYDTHGRADIKKFTFSDRYGCDCKLIARFEDGEWLPKTEIDDTNND